MTLRAPMSILLMMAAVATLAVLAAAQTDPPSSGDWVVEDNSFYNHDLVFGGNITVRNGGTLKLDNMTLTMNVLQDGGLTILVEAGSALELVNTNLRSSDADAHFWFEARGRLVVRSSDVRDLASNSNRWNDMGNIHGGVQVYDGSSVLLNSQFHDSQRINVYVEGCAPRIEGCTFYNAEYYSSYTTYSYSWNFGGYFFTYYTDATGLFLNGADPNITECTFQDNGLINSAYPFYNTDYSNSGVQTFGRGIMAYQSAPNISRCQFLRNGEQPADRTVSGVRQVFFDHFYWDDAYEGGLVCVGSGANPTVYDSDVRNNDIFGVLGMGGGYPKMMERCDVSGNQYLRGSSVYSPSGGVYVMGSSGTMLVANSTFSGNLVVANIWMQDVALHLVNYTNTNNVVTNGYNIYISAGQHRIENSTLEGRPGLSSNIYIGYGRNAPRLRIQGSELRGAEYGIYTTSYNGAYIWMANSTITGVGTATAFLTSTNMDCLDCRLSPERFESYSYSRGSTVRIMYFLRIVVQWQNNNGIEGAFVQVFNRSKEYLYGGITEAEGELGPVAITSRTIYVTGTTQTVHSNSPIKLQAYSAGLKSSEKSEDFIESGTVYITIFDRVPPKVYMFTPAEDQAFNVTNVEVRGMATDVGAGMDTAEVKVDEAGNWTMMASGEQTFSYILVLTEGVHTVYVRVTDKAENVETVTIKNVVVDLTPPLLEVIDPVKAIWFTSRTNYTLRGRVNGQVSLMINRQMVPVNTDGTWSFTHDIYSGSNEFNLVAVDHVGNVFEITKVIVSDSEVPKLILTSPPDNLWTNISQVEVKGITELGATVRVNGEPVTTFDGRFAFDVFLSEGENRIVVEAVDRAKNVERKVRVVNLDSIPPLLRIESPLGDLLTSDPMLNIRGTVDDPSVENIIVNGLLVPVQGSAFQREFRLDEGENLVLIEVWDQGGNYAARRFRVVLDTTLPVLSILEPKGEVHTMSQTVRVRGLVEEGVEFVMWAEPQHPQFDMLNMVRIGNSFRYDALPLVQGTNIIHMEAVDEVGNIAHHSLVVVYDLEPPQIIISPMAERTKSELVQLSGRVNGGNEVRINGVAAVLGSSGEFSESVHLKVGKNELRVVAFDPAGNEASLVVNVVREAEDVETGGILGATLGVSIAVIIVMLVLGMAIIYTARHDIGGGGIEPMALAQEPIIVEDEEPVPPVQPSPERPRPRRGPPGPPGEPHRRRRPRPPQEPDQTEEPEEPDAPPTPPWR